MNFDLECHVFNIPDQNLSHCGLVILNRGVLLRVRSGISPSGTAFDGWIGSPKGCHASTNACALLRHDATKSSITAATPGIRSSINRGKTCPSLAAIGQSPVTQRVGLTCRRAGDRRTRPHRWQLGFFRGAALHLRVKGRGSRLRYPHSGHILSAERYNPDTCV
jgi:hypothetical protein